MEATNLNPSDSSADDAAPFASKVVGRLSLGDPVETSLTDLIETLDALSTMQPLYSAWGTFLVSCREEEFDNVMELFRNPLRLCAWPWVIVDHIDRVGIIIASPFLGRSEEVVKQFTVTIYQKDPSSTAVANLLIGCPEERKDVARRASSLYQTGIVQNVYLVLALEPLRLLHVERKI